jgi:hypothetical protein
MGFIDFAIDRAMGRSTNKSGEPSSASTPVAFSVLGNQLTGRLPDDWSDKCERLDQSCLARSRAAGDHEAQHSGSTPDHPISIRSSRGFAVVSAFDGDGDFVGGEDSLGRIAHCEHDHVVPSSLVSAE